MNSLAIYRGLTQHIQSETSPVFRRDAAPPGSNLIALTGSLAMVFLAVALAIANVLSLSAPTVFFMQRDTLIGMGLIAGALLISVLWTAPVAALAAFGVRQERIKGAWDVLRLTNVEPEQLPLVKAAAMLRAVWFIVLGLSIFSGFLTAALAIPLVIYFSTAGIFTLVFVVTAVGVAVIERLQEIALAASLGLAAGALLRSTVLGLIGGLLIRIATVLILLAMLPSLTDIAPQITVFPAQITAAVWLAACALGGSAALIAVLPTFPTLILALGLILVREMLIWVLYAQVVRADV